LKNLQEKSDSPAKFFWKNPKVTKSVPQDHQEIIMTEADVAATEETVADVMIAEATEAAETATEDNYLI
jgi:hypothetical protein